MKPEKPFFARPPFGRVFWSMLILFIVFVFNMNFTPYFIGVIIGRLGIDPAAVQFETIRLTGNIILFVVFMVVSSRKVWERFEAKEPSSDDELAEKQ